MNDLEKYFTENTGRLISKWKHYFEIYDQCVRKQFWVFFSDLDLFVFDVFLNIMWSNKRRSVIMNCDLLFIKNTVSNYFIVQFIATRLLGNKIGK